MKINKLPGIALLLPFLTLISIADVLASDESFSRFSLNGGLVVVREQTSFALSAEYEYQPRSLYGLGAQASYVFASSAFTQIAAPMAFLHPLLGEWYIAAAPVFYLNSVQSLAGLRLITRAPLMIEVLSLTPVLGVDLIEGGPNYIVGLGISI